MLILRRELFTKVHYFIHLNLSITLFLGYLTFIAGIEEATAYEVSAVQLNITNTHLYVRLRLCYRMSFCAGIVHCGGCPPALSVPVCVLLDAL